MDNVHVDVRNENRPGIGVEVGLIRALQGKRFAAVLERAGIRSEDLDTLRHVVPGAESGRIIGDHQQ